MPVFQGTLYQWATTLTQSGGNLPFAVPLRVDRLDAGLQVRAAAAGSAPRGAGAARRELRLGGSAAGPAGLGTPPASGPGEGAASPALPPPRAQVGLLKRQEDKSYASAADIAATVEEVPGAVGAAARAGRASACAPSRCTAASRPPCCSCPA
jgi:hypothetical protein